MPHQGGPTVLAGARSDRMKILCGFDVRANFRCAGTRDSMDSALLHIDIKPHGADILCLRHPPETLLSERSRAVPPCSAASRVRSADRYQTGFNSKTDCRCLTYPAIGTSKARDISRRTVRRADPTQAVAADSGRHGCGTGSPQCCLHAAAAS